MTRGRRLAGALTIVATLAAALPAFGQAFEVVSVRKAQSERFAASPYGGNQFSINGVTLVNLISLAFGVSSTDLAGGPGWGDSEYYDVVAKAEDGVVLTYEALQPRMQRLLADRFRLVTHREPRRVPGYALVVAKDGPKMKPVDAKTAAGIAIVPGGVRAPSAPTGALASVLTRVVGRPVVDRTGLPGNYRVEIDFAVDTVASTDRPSVFTALQEQLGLRLDSTPVEVQMLVIDAAERPSEN